MWVAKYVASRCDEYDYDDGAHRRSHPRVYARRRLNAAYVQQRKNTRKENLPSPYRKARGKVMGLLRAPDRADKWIEHVVHHHAPPRNVSCGGMNFLGHIREGRTSARIGACHASVADPREQHAHHGNENGCDHVAMTAIAERAERGHWRHRLNHNHAVQNQVPERQSAPQTWRGARRAFLAHAILLFLGNYRSNAASL